VQVFHHGRRLLAGTMRRRVKLFCSRVVHLKLRCMAACAMSQSQGLVIVIFKT